MGVANTQMDCVHKGSDLRKDSDCSAGQIGLVMLLHVQIQRTCLFDKWASHSCVRVFSGIPPSRFFVGMRKRTQSPVVRVST